MLALLTMYMNPSVCSSMNLMRFSLVSGVIIMMMRMSYLSAIGFTYSM